MYGFWELFFDMRNNIKEISDEKVFAGCFGVFTVDFVYPELAIPNGDASSPAWSNLRDCDYCKSG